jgi:hypothetical protein
LIFRPLVSAAITTEPATFSGQCARSVDAPLAFVCGIEAVLTDLPGMEALTRIVYWPAILLGR